MISALFDRARLAQSGFLNSRLFSRLSAEPIGLIDIGARWGVSEIFRLVAELLDVIAFEADPEEAERLAQSAGKNAPWSRLRILPFALADSRRTVTLHLLRRANNSSILPVDMRWYDRYSLAGFEQEKEIELSAVPLDDIVFGELGGPRHGEILKIDTQGSELAILQGAERTLHERTICIVCEASFFTVYQNAPLFPELELHLRKRGFSFYGFLDVQQRSTRKLDKRKTRGRERFMQADAVFFKDPVERGTTDARAISVLAVAAMVLGFFDFALEAAALLPVGGEEIGTIVRQLAAVTPEEVTRGLAEMNRQIAADPIHAAVYLGRLVDSLRDIHTYHDVTNFIENSKG
jgi:FkbM family methyltransferase